MANQVAIIGDGQMGLVLADALVHRGVPVRLWGPFPEDIAALAATREAPKRLPGFKLAEAVELTSVDDQALPGADAIINAIPTQFIRPVWTRIVGGALPGAPVFCVSKGIENDTLLRPSEIIEQVAREVTGQPILDQCVCALCGPTIAAELAQRQPATLVAACETTEFTQQAQDLFNVPWLRIYRHDDPLGVELAGATKNVIALAAGMVDGMGAGANAKSALLARGLAEITRLGVAMGAKRETFFGIAGVGDLATTCFSPSGRNRTCGDRLGKGETLAEILDSTVSVVEGVPTTRSVAELARQHTVEMPITAAVHAILFEGLSPGDAVRQLMDRSPKAEQVG